MKSDKSKNKDFTYNCHTEAAKKERKARKVLIPTLTIGALVLGAGAAVLFVETAKHKINYICEGVDDSWLATHQFDTSSLPGTYAKIHNVKLGHPNIDGYSFAGWYLEGKNDSPLANDTFKTQKYNSDVTLVAKYEIINYRVSLNLGGGHLINLNDNAYDGHTYIVEDDIASTTYNCLDEAFRFPTAERLGYDFSNNGWADQRKETFYEGREESFLGDIDLYADWTLIPYNISYSFSGEGVNEFVDEIINNNTKISNFEKEVVLTKPYLKGYTFEKWVDADGEEITKIPVGTFPNGDFAIVGVFSPIVYNITYSDESQSNHDSLPTSYKRCSNDVTIPNIEPRGYQFKGWLSSNSTSLQYVNTIPHGSTGDITFTAHVQLLTYQITFTTSGVSNQFTDTFNLRNSAISYTIKTDSFSLPQASVPGYQFLGFYDENNHQITGPIEKGSIVGDKVYTAKFEPIEYTITLVNTRTDSTTYRTYTIEDSFDIDDLSSAGYSFDGWFTNGNSKLSAISVGDAVTFQNFTLTSRWTLETYNISYSYVGLGEGASVTNNNPNTYNYENDVVFNQPSVTGYTFKGWTTPSVTTPTLDYSILKHTETGNLNLTANFEKIRYTITRSYKGDGDKVSDSIDYYVDTPEFTLPVISSSHKTFVGWRETGTSTVYGPTARFAGGQTKNINLEAVWEFLGSGTSADPYQLFDDDQLENITEMNKTYKLMNDISIHSSKTDIWDPVGTETTPFNGELDGNSKTIEITIGGNSSENENFASSFGVFGYCGNSSNIHDLVISGSVGADDARLSVNLYGALAARTSGTVDNVTANVRTYLTSSSSERVTVGGLVGYSVGARITNSGCEINNYLNVYADKTAINVLGGVIGKVSGGILEESFNKGNVIGYGIFCSYVGGLVGERDYLSYTAIGWDYDPNVTNPFTGQISNSKKNATLGSLGMYTWCNLYSKTAYCWVGDTATYDHVLNGNYDICTVGYYYYSVIASQNNQNKIAMVALEYIGNQSFDLNDCSNKASFVKCYSE